MKKEDLKYTFIKMRAMGYTHKKICEQLKITKPTAIKWAKSFSTEIERKKEYLIAEIFSERIIEQEQGIMTRLEQFRRKSKMKVNKKLSDKYDRKLLKGLDKIFMKKIKAMHLKMNDEYITNAVFIFDSDVKAGNI